MLQGMWDLSRKGITLVSPSLAVRFLNDPARKPKKVNFYSKFVECFIIIKYLILLNTFSVYIGWFLCVGRGHLFFLLYWYSIQSILCICAIQPISDQKYIFFIPQNDKKAKFVFAVHLFISMTCINVFYFMICISICLWFSSVNLDKDLLIF